MRTIELAGKKVELYDDIEALPIARFHKYNKMLLVEAGIGSDLAGFDTRIEKAIRFSRSKTPQYAATELENLRQSVYFIQNELSPKYLAFAVLVKSIDGNPCNGLSDEGLQRTISLLQDVPNNEMTAQLEAVKKKIDEELRIYFPRLFDDASEKEYYDKLKLRAMVMLDGILNDEKAKPDELDDELITYSKPQCFTGRDSVEISYDKQFESMCLILGKNLHTDPKKFSVLEYYNAYEYLKEENKRLSRKR